MHRSVEKFGQIATSGKSATSNTRAWPAPRQVMGDGFALVELVAVTAIAAITFAMLLPALQHSREDARQAECKDNLRDWGVALKEFHDAFTHFPFADEARTAGDGICFTEHGASVALLPYLDHENRDKEQKATIASGRTANGDPWDWYDAINGDPGIAKTVVPTALCPSAQNGPLTYLTVWGDHGDDICEAAGDCGSMGAMHYSFCTGNSRMWCIDWDDVDESPARPNPFGSEYRPPYNGSPEKNSLRKKGYVNAPTAQERGMFQRAKATATADILDGTSQTIAMGESAGGENWPLCHGVGCDEADLANWDDPANPGKEFPANVSWIAQEPGNTERLQTGILATSNFAGTLERLNKRPVTDSYMHCPGVGGDACRLAQRDCSAGHSVSNFRSDHPAGGHFLFADGSVSFIKQEIALEVYHALGSIGGGEKVPDTF